MEVYVNNIVGMDADVINTDNYYLYLLRLQYVVDEETNVLATANVVTIFSNVDLGKKPIYEIKEHDVIQDLLSDNDCESIDLIKADADDWSEYTETAYYIDF